eukprot:gene13349-9181_t
MISLQRLDLDGVWLRGQRIQRIIKNKGEKSEGRQEMDEKRCGTRAAAGTGHSLLAEKLRGHRSPISFFFLQVSCMIQSFPLILLIISRTWPNIEARSKFCFPQETETAPLIPTRVD